MEQRKEWLTNWMEEGRRRKELGLPEVYLYEKDTRAVHYTDFVNKELVLFSNMDNERSIPRYGGYSSLGSSIAYGYFCCSNELA